MSVFVNVPLHFSTRTWYVVHYRHLVVVFIRIWTKLQTHTWLLYIKLRTTVVFSVPKVHQHHLNNRSKNDVNAYLNTPFVVWRHFSWILRVTGIIKTLRTFVFIKKLNTRTYFVYFVALDVSFETIEMSTNVLWKVKSWNNRILKTRSRFCKAVCWPYVIIKF